MWKRKTRSAVLLAVGLALVIIIVAYAATVAIDTFNDGYLDMKATWNNTSVTQSVTGSMIGGSRDARVNWISGGDIVLQVDYGSNPGSNTLAFSQGSQGTGTGLLQWDGSDNSISLDATGLDPSEDLTSNGTNDVIRVRVISNDNPVGFKFKVYTDASNWSDRSFQSPGNVTNDVVDILLPFTSFVTQGGSGADFSDVGAIELLIDGTLNAEADVTIDLMEATAVRDFGDLPSGYSVASHIPQGLRLGNNVDTEASTQVSAGATGDDNLDADDEDGVTRDGSDNWSAGTTVHLNVTVNGCANSPCYLNGWIDGNSDTDFDDTGEHVLSDYAISNGSNQSIAITVPPPNDYKNTSKYARFRICKTTATCNTDNATDVVDGEVEDYKWDFGPTAITLSTLDSGNGTSVYWIVIGIALLLFVAGISWVVVKKQQAE